MERIVTTNCYQAALNFTDIKFECRPIKGGATVTTTKEGESQCHQETDTCNITLQRKTETRVTKQDECSVIQLVKSTTRTELGRLLDRSQEALCLDTNTLVGLCAWQSHLNVLQHIIDVGNSVTDGLNYMCTMKEY